MQTKYYLSFEQVGIIRRIPLKEQDPDMQGILDAFTQAFRIAKELDDDDTVNTVDLINALNHIDDISRFKGLLLEGDTIDHVTVAIKFEPESDVKEDIKKHLANDIWETIYDTLCSSKDTITQETIEMLHSNIDAFYKQEVTREVKPFKKKKPSYQS